MSDDIPWLDITNVDSALHAPARIAIMLFLLPRSKAKFAIIQDALGVTPGNLSSHLKKLETSNYVAIEKVFVENKPTTIINLTPEGYGAIRNYANILNNAIDNEFG